MSTSTHAKLLPGLLTALALSGAAQAGGPYVIHTVSPCRVVDTRYAVAGPFPGSGQRLAANQIVSFYVTGDEIAGQGGDLPDCGIPYGTAKGMFINVTAVRPQGTGTSGYLTLYPYGESKPTASTINFQPDTIALANGVMVPLCDPAVSTCTYDLTVANGPGLAVHMVIDVTGYLAEEGGGAAN